MRNLASIQKIKEITPIEGADRIECATVLGWNLIVKKGEFKVGDLCVYIEIDSRLPNSNPAFAFMEKHKFRVRTLKMRGVVSQGLALPLSAFGDAFRKLKEGSDVTDKLGIVKYDPEFQDPKEKKRRWYSPLMKYKAFRRIAMPFIAKRESCAFPAYIIAKSDETRIQSMPEMFETYGDDEFIVTEKLDGQSATYTLERRGWLRKPRFTVSSRNLMLKRDDGSNWWHIAHKYNIEKTLRSLMREYPARSWAIQGEICGSGVQKNNYKISGLEFFVFRMKRNKMGPENQYELLDPLDGQTVLKEYRLKWVPILGRVTLKSFNMKSIVEYADGKSAVNKDADREGLVFVRELDPTVSFKAVSNAYLLKS